MNTPKYTSTAIIVSLALSLAFLGAQRAGPAYATPNFPLKEVMGEIQNISPTDNGSYTGGVPLNISVWFSARSDAPNSSLIPYRDISCIYQLDNGEWRNASLYYTSEQSAWYDPTFQGYWNQLSCNYSAVLQGMSNGAHLLDIDLKPDSIWEHYRISSNGTNVQNNLHDNATITFYVFGDYDQPVLAGQTESVVPEIGFSIVVISAIITVTTAALFLRKRRSRFK